MREIEDSVVTRTLPGTDIRPGHRIVITRSLGPVVVRQATPAELAIIHRHPECLRPETPTPPSPTVRPRILRLVPAGQSVGGHALP